MMPTVEVLDSFMSYGDAGAGDIPVVFLHGNPTSSYLWRNVIPQVADQTRCLAPDLIGMGESGKPDSAYRLADHVRYLDAWFDAVGLGEVVIIGHDWGGTLGMDWAAPHPGRVRGIAVIETFLRPMRWEDMPPQAAELFRGYRSQKGEEMVLENNMFIEVNLPRGMAGGLAKSDHDVYRAPFLDPAARSPAAYRKRLERARRRIRAFMKSTCGLVKPRSVLPLRPAGAERGRRRPGRSTPAGAHRTPGQPVRSRCGRSRGGAAAYLRDHRPDRPA
jgi:pimeloyl-ACP methyl ester carboxylesterase